MNKDININDSLTQIDPAKICDIQPYKIFFEITVNTIETIDYLKWNDLINIIKNSSKNKNI